MSLEFLPQCCDADFYLALGRQCALAGQCYDPLRPQGAVLWFSLPYRLGLAPSSLLWLHLLLWVCSVFGATRLLVRDVIAGGGQSAWRTVIACLACALVHVVYFLPVLFNALTDAPAGLLALLGCWIVLGWRGNGLVVPALAGLLFGLAAWLRVFYLWPVVALCVVFVIGGFLQGRLKPHLYFVVAACLPMFLHLEASHRQTGQWTYMAQAQDQALSAVHFSMPVGGYDTQVTRQPVYWFADCGPLNTLPLLERPWRQQLCLLNSRLQFYFASYSPVTYLPDAPAGSPWRRYGSPGLFAVHALLWFCALRVLWRWRTAGGCVLVFAGACLAQGLLVIPEQRFLLVPMTLLACLAVVGILQRFSAAGRVP